MTFEQNGILYKVRYRLKSKKTVKSKNIYIYMYTYYSFILLNNEYNIYCTVTFV